MLIIEDYDAIAKRLRELQLTAAPEANEPSLDRWRDMSADTARIYAQNRRTGLLADVLMQRHGFKPLIIGLSSVPADGHRS